MSGIEFYVSIFASTVVGFIGGLKTGAEIAKFFEERSSTEWKKKWNLKLNDYWLNVLTTPFPRLASVEAGKVRAYLKKYFSGFESPLFAKLAISLLLTTLAFLIGDLVYVLSQVFNFGQQFNFSDPSFPQYIVYLENVIDVIFGIYLVFKLLKILKSKRNIKHNTQDWIVLWVLLWIASNYFVSLGYSLSFGRKWLPHWSDILGLSCLTVGLGLFLIRQKYNNRGKRILLIGLLMGLTLIAPWLFRLSTYTESSTKYPLALIYFFEETSFYLINTVADFLTFALTLTILQWISKDRSVENFFYILLDLSTALAFAVLVGIGYDIFSHIKELVINPATGAFKMTEVIQTDARQWKLGPLLFSMTTLIPTVIFMVALLGRFLAKIISLAVGHLSHYLFWKRKEDIQRSPIYMTITLFGVIIGIAVANISLMRFLAFLQG